MKLPTWLFGVALFLAKRIGSSVFVFKIVFFTEHTEFTMQDVLLVHLLTRSMPRTVGPTSNVGWAESLPGARWCGRGLQCAVSARSLADPCVYFLSSLQNIPRTQHKLSGQNVTSHGLRKWLWGRHRKWVSSGGTAGQPLFLYICSSPPWPAKPLLFSLFL